MTNAARVIDGVEVPPDVFDAMMKVSNWMGNPKKFVAKRPVGVAVEPGGKFALVTIEPEPIVPEVDGETGPTEGAKGEDAGKQPGDVDSTADGEKKKGLVGKVVDKIKGKKANPDPKLIEAQAALNEAEEMTALAKADAQATVDKINALPVDASDEQRKELDAALETAIELVREAENGQNLAVDAYRAAGGKLGGSN